MKLVLCVLFFSLTISSEELESKEYVSPDGRYVCSVRDTNNEYVITIHKGSDLVYSCPAKPSSYSKFNINWETTHRVTFYSGDIGRFTILKNDKNKWVFYRSNSIPSPKGERTAIIKGYKGKYQIEIYNDSSFKIEFSSKGHPNISNIETGVLWVTPHMLQIDLIDAVQIYRYSPSKKIWQYKSYKTAKAQNFTLDIDGKKFIRGNYDGQSRRIGKWSWFSSDGAILSTKFFIDGFEMFPVIVENY